MLFAIYYQGDIGKYMPAITLLELRFTMEACNSVNSETCRRCASLIVVEVVIVIVV